MGAVCFPGFSGAVGSASQGLTYRELVLCLAAWFVSPLGIR